MIETGQKHTSELIVSESITAIQMGSGDMPVFATPAMMALMENAAMLAVKDELPEGTRIRQNRYKILFWYIDNLTSMIYQSARRTEIQDI